MALELIVEDNSGQKTLIFIDNQAAILFLKQPKQQSGQYLLQEIAMRIKALSGQFEVYYIPANSGVSANKAADLAAKEAPG